MTRVRRKGMGTGGDVIDELSSIVRRGTTMRRQARELRQNMTETECILWEALRGKRLDTLKFYRQVAIDRFIVDFYCPGKKLVVEIDGDVHEEKTQQEHDEIRSAFLRSQGLHILRIRNDEVLHNLESVLQKITRTCDHPLPSPSPHCSAGRGSGGEGL